MCKYVAKSASFNIVHCLFFRPLCDFTRAVWWPARWMVGLRNDIWYIMTMYNISDDMHVEWWDSQKNYIWYIRGITFSLNDGIEELKNDRYDIFVVLHIPWMVGLRNRETIYDIFLLLHIPWMVGLRNLHFYTVHIGPHQFLFQKGQSLAVSWSCCWRIEISN